MFIIGLVPRKALIFDSFAELVYGNHSSRVVEGEEGLGGEEDNFGFGDAFGSDFVMGMGGSGEGEVLVEEVGKGD